MSEYNVYPAIDEDDNFHPDILAKIVAGVASSATLSDSELRLVIQNLVTNGTSGLGSSIAELDALMDTGRLSQAKLDSQYGPTTFQGDRTGVTDVTSELNAALAAPPRSTYRKLALMPGKYKITDTLQVDISKTGLVAPYGGVIIDATGLPTDGRPGIAFTRGQQISNASPDAWVFENITLAGPGRLNTAGPGLYFVDDGISIANFNISGYVKGFGTGVLYGQWSYCINAIRLNIHQCNIGVASATGATDFGERMTFIGCTIYGCSLAIRNMTQGRYHFVACSIDYCAQVLWQGPGSKIDFLTCHIENEIGNTDDPNPWFVLDGGSLYMSGGVLNCSSRSGPGFKYMVQNNNDPLTGNLALFENILVYGFSNPTRKFSNGPGLTLVKSVRSGSDGPSGSQWLTTSDAASMMVDGKATSSILEDEWYVTGGTGLVDTESKLEDSVSAIAIGTTNNISGRQFRYTSKSSAYGRVEVRVPIQPHKMYTGTCDVRKIADIEGAVYVEWLYAKVSSKGVANKTQRLILRAVTNSTLDSFDKWYGQNTSTVPVRVPGWATHILMRVTSSNANVLLMQDLGVFEV